MYTVINRYQIPSGRGKGIMAQLYKHLQPVLSSLPGFQACYLVQVAETQIAAICISETSTQALTAMSSIIAWMTRQSRWETEALSEPLAGLTITVTRVAEEKTPERELQPVPGEEVLRGCF